MLLRDYTEVVAGLNSAQPDEVVEELGALLRREAADPAPGISQRYRRLVEMTSRVVQSLGATKDSAELRIDLQKYCLEIGYTSEPCSPSSPPTWAVAFANEAVELSQQVQAQLPSPESAPSKSGPVAMADLDSAFVERWSKKLMALVVDVQELRDPPLDLKADLATGTLMVLTPGKPSLPFADIKRVATWSRPLNTLNYEWVEVTAGEHSITHIPGFPDQISSVDLMEASWYAIQAADHFDADYLHQETRGDEELFFAAWKR